MHRKPRLPTKPDQTEIYRLAYVTGISPTTVRKWLAGKKPVHPLIKLTLEKAAQS